ncbi:hypothetical protein Hdeb2414_s0668g00932891 [Helianthus debilis subsp. tardiflorus]
MIVLDLYADVKPVWESSSQFYGVAFYGVAPSIHGWCWDVHGRNRT